MTPDDFIAWLKPTADSVCAGYNLPSGVLVAQGAIESGWGTSTIGQYNLFGRKWNGTGPYIETGTQEDDGSGNLSDTTAKFQDYTSLADACTDWCVLMTQESCYADAVAALPDVEQFVKLMAAHYATDINYADKILQTMRTCNLM